MKKLFFEVTELAAIPIWGGGMVGSEPSAAKSLKNALYGGVIFLTYFPLRAHNFHKNLTLI